MRPALEQADAALRAGDYVAGFVTYEAARAFSLAVREPDGRLPLVCFGVFDPSTVDAVRHLPAEGSARIGEWAPSISHEEYRHAIAAIRRRIEQGDTYQINFTFRLRAPFDGSSRALMRDLLAGQAGEWSAWIDIGSHVICSASPELFVRIEGTTLECRPMKGTAPRGCWAEQDAAFGARLRASEKNRAENVMIVDMVRNDLGRLARTGSVHVTSLFDVARYPLQWQMTSTVRAEAVALSLAGIFEHMFPSGSITGAPKVSAMSIIRDLETTPRGVYTGAIGYLSPRGRGHFSVAIRTVVLDRAAEQLEMGIGSGVVWDSVDDDEYEECLLKAGPLASRSFRHRHAAYVVPDPPDFRLLESLLWTPSAGFALLEAHLSRLHASAACFGFPMDLAVIRSMLETATLDLRGPSKVRLMLEADGSVLCEALDLAPLPLPLRTALATEPIDRHDPFLYHKTTRRTVYERARASRPGADAVILWNEAGEITEGTEANIVIERAGRRLTPPVECGLLPGTMRAELVATGALIEERITKEALRRADRVWLINSVRGWMDVEIQY